MAVPAEKLTVDLPRVPLADALAAVRNGWRRGWTPPARLAVSEWADRHRVLSQESSARPGQWRTDDMPFLREIMDCLSSHHPARRIAFMKSTQVGGTETLNNWVGYIIHHAPGPAMITQPTVEMAQRWSRQRLSPMIAESDVLRERIKPARSRDSGNTTLLKEYPGGLVVISGANSAASLRSMPVRYLGMDEVDEYPDDVDGQGDPCALAERRTSTYTVRAKVFQVSSPKLKDSSRIEEAFEAGDQRHYHVPCPHCGEWIVFEDEMLQDDGYMVHRGCGVPIEEHNKNAMLAQGQWVAHNPDGAYPSFHINAFYSPTGLGDTWAEIAAYRAEAREDPIKLKTFTNTILGLPSEGQTKRIEPNALRELAGKWPARTVPPGGLIITAAVDVQHNRFAVMLVAWGRNESAAVIDYVELPGDPTREDDWDVVWEYLSRPVRNRAGLDLRVSCAAIDSGNWTHEVYQFVRKHQHQGVIAVKGSSQGNKPVIGRPTPQDVNAKGRKIKRGVSLWPVGGDTAKTTLLGRIEADLEESDIDARRFRFAQDLPPEIYDQLAAEQFDIERGRWVKIRSRRNEALDTLVYAYAAACHPRIRLHTLREPDWARLEAQIEPPTADLFAAGDPPEPSEHPVADTPRPAQSGVGIQPAQQPEPSRPAGGNHGFGSEDWSL